MQSSSVLPGTSFAACQRVHRSIVVVLVARALCTSGSEVGTRDLLRGGFGAARPEGCFKFILSGDAFFAAVGELAAIDVRWQAGRRFGVALGFHLIRDTSLGA